VTARAYKVKGQQTVELQWLNFSGATVEIRRDGGLLVDMPTANDELHIDDIGVKGGGQVYQYEVCEIGPGDCAYASAGF